MEIVTLVSALAGICTIAGFVHQVYSHKHSRQKSHSTKFVFDLHIERKETEK